VKLLSVEFTEDMIRKYTPYYRWNAFDKTDIEDVQNIIDFARGLVLKNTAEAERYETDQMMKDADLYIRAIDHTLDEHVYTEYQRLQIIKDYTERNKYYLNLNKLYGISYYVARKAKDRFIIKEINSTLDKHKKNLFELCYYEALNYFSKVLYTHAWDNQRYNREFFDEYIIFMTVQRYINLEMKDYFNVDTYTKRQLKNGFISNGLDYFDSFPIEYQRRTYKLLNDMIRNKGTNKVFDIIKDIFSYNFLKINKYTLGKVKDAYDADDLTFYRTEINNNVDVYNDPRVDYDKLTGEDPYWRVRREEVLDKEFNTLNTKYISSDIDLDVIENSKLISYFMSLISELQRLHTTKVFTYMYDNAIPYDEAVKAVGLKDDDFIFIDRNISDKPIDIYNAIIALIVLVFNQLNWKSYKTKRLEHDTFGFAFTPTTRYFDTRKESINDITVNLVNYLNYNEHHLPAKTVRRLLDLIDNLKIDDFKLDEQRFDLNYIFEKYNAKAVYKNQLLAFGKLIAGKYEVNRIEKLVSMNRLTDALYYVSTKLLQKEGYINELGKFKYLTELVRDYINLTLSPKTVPTTQFISFKQYRDYFLNYAHIPTIKSELDKFVKKLNHKDLNKVYYKKGSTLFDIVPQISKSINDMIEKELYQPSQNIKLYPELNAFLTVFHDLFSDYSEDGQYLGDYRKFKYSMESLANMYRRLDKLRHTVEDYMLETDDPMVYQSLKKLWYIMFATDNNDLVLDKKGTNERATTYLEYLKENDINLYYYTQIKLDYSNIDTLDYDGIVRDKITELTTAIINHLNLNDYNFFEENNFIGITDYIKRYVYILVNIFKAYTIQTVSSNTIYNLNNRIENTIKVLDQASIYSPGKIKLDMEDTIEVLDSYSINSHRHETDRLSITDRVSIKVKTP